jgi:hypothetical protein
MEETENGRLHRTTDVEGLILDGFWQIGHHGVAHLCAGRAVENQAKSAPGVVLANQHDGTVKKGALQFSAVQEQLPLQEVGGSGHFV